MAYSLGARSLQRLAGLHPDLVAIVKRAICISPIDFAVIEGLRTITRQKELYDSGASKTLKGRHLTGHAVDLGAFVNGKINWDWQYYCQIAISVKQSAEELGLPIEWGGDWDTFKDGPHFQLPWREYP